MVGLSSLGLCFASGSAALACIAHLLNDRQVRRVACIDDVYGGTRRYFSKLAMNLEVSYYAELDRPLNADMIWIETPTNPTLRLVDIEATAKANPKALIVVDNTFMTPIFQKPLSLGAHLVMHSASKYLNGHSDVILGAVVTNDDALARKLRFLQNALGGVPSPIDCYLVLRGLKTLWLRMGQHARNAQAVAEMLEEHPAVERVSYPGLRSHPQHQLALRQHQSGHSGMVSFWFRDVSKVDKFCQSTRLFTLAESLGCVESLMEVPAAMTHAGLTQEVRDSLSITPSLIRLSVGIEDTQDLLDDLLQAINSA